MEIEEIKKLLEEIDDFLCYLEDFTHGSDGNKITELRHKIQYTLKHNKTH